MEPTSNMAYKQAKSFSITVLTATKEQFVDHKVRTFLLDGFKTRLGLA